MFPRALAWPYLKPLHWKNMKAWIACCAFYADRLAGGKVIHGASSNQVMLSYYSKCDHSEILRICRHMYFSNLLAHFT